MVTNPNDDLAAEKGCVMTAGRSDPRPARSRARLLESATALLRAGGPSAVTVDAVLRGANVARATLYRHFPSGNDLVAAAFHALIPPAPVPADHGSLRDRLIALVQAQAQLIAEAPVSLTALSWLSLGGDMAQYPGNNAASAEVRTLRERVAEQYAAPFDAILGSPDAVAELGEVDHTEAAALLLGPIALGKLSTLPDVDYNRLAVLAVDGYLATHGRTRVTSGNNGSAGA
jgi:AcrR family transcriptional regulator